MARVQFINVKYSVNRRADRHEEIGEEDMSIKALARTIWILIIVVVLVIAAGGAVYYYEVTRSTPAISLATTSLTAAQGTAITFSLYNLVSNGKATIYFGDGQSATNLNTSSSSATHTYEYPGAYLVTAQETVGGKAVSSTNSSMKAITITPTVSSTLAPMISVPVISQNVTMNPSEPVVTANTSVIFRGGFLEAPTGNNMTVSKYVWNFTNGISKTILANSTTLNPVENPVSTTYTHTGLYPVSLTLVTTNVSSSQTYSTTVERTVAVSSSAQPYKLYVYAGSIPSPGVITVAENIPGGPYSFDPQIDYESVGYEVILNTMGTLLVYNGSSVTQFIPMLAASIPTVQNGGISSDNSTFTFTIRSGLKFSNGDPITAFDVWYTTIRNLLFVGGAPGTPSWILSQYMIPQASSMISLMQNSTDTADYQAIMKAVTYNNNTNTVTFHLAQSVRPEVFFTAVADPLGAGVMDAAWLESVGAGINFTQAGFYSYQNQANEESYNTKVQWSPVCSGPYEIQSYVPGESVVLAPNSGFVGVPGIPAVNDTILIQWVKDPETAYNLFTSGQSDIVTGLPNTYMPLIKGQEAAGQADIYEVSNTMSCFFYVFNANVSTSVMASTFGSGYTIPPNYFANTLVREAFAYAYNYTQYIDRILGNDVYGANFGNPYAGVIVNGLPDYVPPSELQNVPTWNLTYATQLMKKSGEANDVVNIPIIVTSGDTIDYAGALMWATALHQMDSNITATPFYQEFATQIAEQVPGQNPMPIYYLGWIADYPLASDFVNAMYMQGGTYPSATGFVADYLNVTCGYPSEAANYTKMNTLIQEANAAVFTNATKAAQLYKQAEQIAINLYMYVYLYQPNVYWMLKPYISGYKGIQSEENPQIGGALDSIYYWWRKG
jgi:ABC-type transport system substrate-binding protein/flagellar basal body-associated protein FliL